MQQILFTSPCRTGEVFLGRFASTDHLAYRLTREQEPLVLHGHVHVSPLHMLAQNVSWPSTVLEYPSFDDFDRELRRGGYDVVAISFKAVHADVLHEMCSMIRRLSPRSKIVLGGYGAVCAPELFSDPRWEGLFDHVCHGEGISFLRELLGDDDHPPIKCQLPKEGASLPWLNPRPTGTTGVVLSGLGCTYRCHFCATSAATRGQYVEVLDGDGVYRAMRDYWQNTPFTSTVSIYDENFLMHRDKVDRLGERIRADEPYGLRRMNYAAFGSLNEVAKYDPDELLLNGVDMLWIGVESKLTRLKKRKGTVPEEAFPLLHSIGIKTIGSWIIGQDDQNPDNIQEDTDYFVSLDTTFQQLSIMIAFPALPLWRLLKRQGRIPDEVPWTEYHLYGESFQHEHFSHEFMVNHLEGMYRRIHQENGPALMKVLEVSLNGFEHCSRSRHELLRRDKAAFFRRRCATYASLLPTALAHAPSSRVRSRVEDLQSRLHETFGKPSRLEQVLSDRIRARADAHMLAIERAPAPPMFEPFRRYCYPERDERDDTSPYTVAYPDGAGRTDRQVTAALSVGEC